MTGNEGKLNRLAAGQHGLFSRAQVRDCGYSAYQARRRIEVGDWQVILGPILAFRGTRSSPPLVDRAAGLAVPDGVLGGPSAARVHGLGVDDPRPWIVVSAAARPRVPGLGVLRDRLSPHDVQFLGGVLLTSRPRTVFDCLRILPEQRAVDLLDRALQQRWITLDELTDRVRAFVGRHGVNRLVRLVASAGSGTRSAAERLAVGLLRRSGIDGWRANAPIHDADGTCIGIADLAFDTERVIVELDGRAYHSTSERFEHDRYRQNRLTGNGWTVLRFTWRDLTQRPGYVVGTIRQVTEGRRLRTRSASDTAHSVPNQRSPPASGPPAESGPAADRAPSGGHDPQSA